MHTIKLLILSSSTIIWFGANPTAEDGNPTFPSVFCSKYWPYSFIRLVPMCNFILSTPNSWKIDRCPQLHLTVHNWGKESFMWPGCMWQTKEQNCLCLTSCGSQVVVQLPRSPSLFHSSMTVFLWGNRPQAPHLSWIWEELLDGNNTYPTWTGGVGAANTGLQVRNSSKLQSRADPTATAQPEYLLISKGILTERLTLLCRRL